MKLKDNFITHQYDDVQIMIGSENTNFRGIVQSNATAAFMLSKPSINNKYSSLEPIKHFRIEFNPSTLNIFLKYGIAILNDPAPVVNSGHSFSANAS